MQVGSQTGFQHNRCRERTRNGRGPNQIREMFFAEFSTLSEPILRSAPVLSFPRLVCLRFILNARGHAPSHWSRRRESHTHEVIWRFAFVLEAVVESFK